MPSWRNWSGRQRAKPAAVHFARSETDVAALLREADRRGDTVRAAGAGHSHAPLVPTSGIVVDTSGLAGVISTDRDRRRAWVWSGTRIHALGRPLHDAGLALANQGDIDRQAIAGATATGTHGTGRTLGNLSTAVVGAQVALASGDIVSCDASRESALFAVVRQGLGAAGVVTRLELALRDAYRLQERSWSEPFDAILERTDPLSRESRHFEFFWYPHTDLAQAKAIDETQNPARYPLAPEGSRCAWSYEVLPNDRPHLHTEMEYSVAADDGPACLREIRALIRRDFPELRWPVEYRTLAADDVWLSTAYGRPTVTISVHQGIEEDEAPYFRACEAIFRTFAGRPHWGKVNYLARAELAAIHPRWDDWWAARDRFDPKGTMLNDYLRAIRP
jgi:FAD/FMN-containing dehydrogenase